MNSVPAQLLLTLPGSVALSPFRIEKLVAGFKPGLAAAVTLETRFVHFAQLSAPLDEAEQDILGKILTYGTAAGSEPGGHLYLVLPRFGTVSPWSSKATDIARNCGLAKVVRLERGTAFYATMKDGKAIRGHADHGIRHGIHDRMTETVVRSLDEAARLFGRGENLEAGERALRCLDRLIHQTERHSPF